MSERAVRASVIIVNYNHKAAILRCLESVLASLPADCEVVVVDNASSDGSASAIRAAFPAVSLVTASTNGGFGAGCNLGARAAAGTFLVFLNPDTTVDPAWLAALLAPLESSPRTGLVTARILLADGTRRINVCSINVHLTGLALMRGMGAPAHAYPRAEEVASVSGAAFAIRREVFHTLGGFDEEMFLYMEDVDLSWRARLAGWTCAYAHASVVLHDYSLKLKPGRIFHQERNRYLMLLKCLRWPTLVLLLPALALAELVTWGFVLTRRLSPAEKISAYRWAITNGRAIRAKRQSVQQSRTVKDRELLQRTVGALAFEQVTSPTAAVASRLVFNPLFSVWRWLLLAVVWW